MFSGKFTNIVARWPGATHDSFIFRNSQLSTHMEEKNGGYPCKPYLMTPYGNPATLQQQHFNRSLCGTRVKIEHALGVLK
jgi:hypothetical protein